MTGMTTTETEIEAGITVINMIDVISMMDHQKLKESSEKIQLGGELVFKWEFLSSNMYCYMFCNFIGQLH